MNHESNHEQESAQAVLEQRVAKLESTVIKLNNQVVATMSLTFGITFLFILYMVVNR